MDLSLIDGNFYRRLAKRHLLRRTSGLLPLRPRDLSTLKSKTRLALVYRSLARGIFKEIPPVSEKIFNTVSAGNMTSIYLSFGLLRKETPVMLAEKGGWGGMSTEPWYGLSHLTSREGSQRAAKSIPTLAMIPALIMHRYLSRTVSTGGENEGTAARAERAPIHLPAQWRNQMPNEDDREGWPVPSVTSEAQMLHRTEKEPAHLIGDTKPAVAMRSSAQMLHRTEESPARLIGETRPAVALRSSAQMLHRTEKGPARLIGDTKPAAAMRSLHQTRYGIDKPPLVIRQSPKINVGDLLAEEGYPAMDYWTHQRTTGLSTIETLHPSAPMVYATPTSPPVERESKKEVSVKKEEPKAPAINISTLSDRIYSMIESRLKIDRERRGVCG